MIGKTVSHYRIVGPLGAGGMGVVYAGEDVRLGRPVALKFVPEDLARDRQAVERLKSEARTASGLNHANICTIFDIGDHEGQPFIVMELLKGQTLRDRLTAAPLKTLDVVELGIQVADALDSAHRQNIIHRDIKPANLFLVERGPVKVLDFGLAKFVLTTRRARPRPDPTREQTAEGVTLGTVAYMSPEQVTGEELDGRTDLFSLGVVLYEALTGHQPFTGKTSAVVFSAILTHAPVAPIVLNPDVAASASGSRQQLSRERQGASVPGRRGTPRGPEARQARSRVRSLRRVQGHRGGDGRAGCDEGRAVPATTAPPSDSEPATQAAGTTREDACMPPSRRSWPSRLVAAASCSSGPRLAAQTTTESVAPSPSPAFIRAQLALAAASIESKDYRAALDVRGRGASRRTGRQGCEPHSRRRARDAGAFRRRDRQGESTAGGWGHGRGDKRARMPRARSIRRRPLSASCRRESPDSSRRESAHAGTHSRRNPRRPLNSLWPACLRRRSPAARRPRTSRPPLPPRRRRPRRRRPYRSLRRRDRPQPPEKPLSRRTCRLRRRRTPERPAHRRPLHRRQRPPSASASAGRTCGAPRTRRGLHEPARATTRSFAAWWRPTRARSRPRISRSSGA